MSHEQFPTKKKTPESVPQAGILKEKDRELESRIVDSLKKLSTKLTRKDIEALLRRIEIKQDINELRRELEKEEKLEGVTIDEATLQEIISLIREAQEAAERGLNELKIDLSKLNPSLDYEANPTIYLSSKRAGTSRLEKSRLGENIILDLKGFSVGVLDSAAAILRFLVTLLGDIVRLPRDVIRAIRR
jgi:hypothetical protein